MQPSTYEIIAWALSGDTVEHLRKAKKKCRAILSKGPNNAAILQLMGTIELQLGNAAAALEWTQKALVVAPGSAELHCLHARTLAARKKHAEAVVAFKRAIALKPDYARAFYGLGAALKECGDEAGAINAYLDALAIEPDYPEALNDLGVLFNTRGAWMMRRNTLHTLLRPGPIIPFRSTTWVWCAFYGGTSARPKPCIARPLPLNRIIPTR